MRKKTIRRKRRLKIIPCLILCFISSGVLVVTDHVFMASKDRFDDYVMDPEKSLEEQLKELAQIDNRFTIILNHRDRYPDDILMMVAEDPDTLDFVLEYPQRKGTHSVSTLGKIDKGEIPMLLQWDQRWGYAAYGDTVIALGGCAPTALSMVFSGLLGDHSITPYVIAQYAQENGYYVSGIGSSWDLIEQAAFHYGIKCSVLPLSKDAVFAALKRRYPIICSMAPGDFTASGHFIVLSGVKNGQIKVNDPNSIKRSEQLWDYEVLEDQINQLWVFHI